ncbi:fimbrial subunit [Xenorhabdus beddingii]|uniref:Fimbrial subunit n=1 Tax=Xenorhabdus beddingii TaxID=40578 RepID=A0A1Y2SMN7_9GAMM|nr:fimbrial protein [Xenorhabdus beddingii]OTA20211.1 fimbrial subunit [Xenorhabdus beddingii]
MKMYQWILLVCAMVWQGTSYADVKITVKGVLQEPTCDVTGENGDKTVDVDLRNIALEAVGTAKAEKSFQLNVHCDSPAPVNKVLKMKIQPSGYRVMNSLGNNVLSTSMKGLGIALTHKNKPIVLNNWVSVEGVDLRANKPEGMVSLTARLVTENRHELQAGSFQSAASFLMSYQ